MKIPSISGSSFLGEDSRYNKTLCKVFTDLYSKQYAMVNWCPLDVPHTSVLSFCNSRTPGRQLIWDVLMKDNEFFPTGV